MNRFNQNDLFVDSGLSVHDDENKREPVNLLPQDGEALYYGPVLTGAEADYFFEQLWQSIAWQHDQLIIAGRHITTKRKVAWYGDKPFLYRYSNTTKQALPWVDVLQVLKTQVERCTGECFNACLLNLYHNGSEAMSWHSDAEKELKPEGAIASLSLGAERKFSFKHKRTKQTVALPLQHGSVLVMKGATQQHWLHALPATKKVHQPRINLTFRTVID